MQEPIWSITVSSAQPIAETDVEAIINEMPEKLRAFRGQRATAQPWGWPAAVNVHRPSGRNLRLSGSYLGSARVALDFASRLQFGLHQRGYPATAIDTRQFDMQ